MLGAQRLPARDPQGRDLNVARLPGSCVLANVYDLGASSALKRTNNLSRMLGGGVYHAGVEVYGTEWSYGYIEWGTGVHKCAPRTADGHTYRATQKMGYTRLTQESVGKVLERMKGEWPGKDYQFLEHNCLSFCSAFLQALGLGPLPPWVDRYGRTACKVTSAIPVSGLVKAANLVRVATGGAQDDHHQEVHHSPRYTPSLGRQASGPLHSPRGTPSLLRSGKRLDADAAIHPWAPAQVVAGGDIGKADDWESQDLGLDQGGNLCCIDREASAVRVCHTRDDLAKASVEAPSPPASSRGRSKRANGQEPKVEEKADEGNAVIVLTSGKFRTAETKCIINEADAKGAALAPASERKPLRRKPTRKKSRPTCAGGAEAAAPQAACTDEPVGERGCDSGALADGGEAAEAAAAAAAGREADCTWPLPPDGFYPAPLVPAASPVAPMLVASSTQLSSFV